MPQKKSMPRTCEYCGAGFMCRPVDAQPHRGGARFCSGRCATLGVNKWSHLPKGARGADNPHWKGGETRGSRGYWYVLRPEHPRALKSGYVKRATLVAEQKMGRFLLDGEVAHHKDRNRENDDPDNLEVMLETEHHALHLREDAAWKRRRAAVLRQPEHPSNRRYQWPSDADLLALAESRSLRKIAADIGCGHKAVDRRLKRIRAKQLPSP